MNLGSLDVASAAAGALDWARWLAERGQDEAAKFAYLDALRLDPCSFNALNELGALANASGHRSAARSAWQRAVALHPDNPVGRVNLGSLLLEDGAVDAARVQFETALVADPGLREAHHGLARVLDEIGDPGAASHRDKAFANRAIVTKPFRGPKAARPILLLVSARGGNIPTAGWIDDRRSALSIVYADYYDSTQALPAHEAVVNLIGDADLCERALAGAEAVIAASSAPVINPPALVRATGRAENARRLRRIPRVVTPAIKQWTRCALSMAEALRFPLLVRARGFHTGRHFHLVRDRAALAAALGSAPGDEWLTLDYLEARGADGLFRKYRVMFIGGEMYPVHLAVSAGWKVHYFTAGMAGDAAYREEEARFLTDMPGVLGPCAIAALTAVGRTLGLDYAGADFALSADGSVLLFEANATMAIIPPDADPVWDYRRPAITGAQQAARRLLTQQAGTLAPDTR